MQRLLRHALTPMPKANSYSILLVILSLMCAAESTFAKSTIHPPSAEQNLILQAPITAWADAIPLGNGLTGGLLWGQGNLLRLSLDRGDLWDERTAPRAGKEWWKRDTWAKGPAASWENSWNHVHPTKLPAGRIEITLAPGQTVTRFELNLASAEGFAHLNDGRVSALFSAVEPVAILRIPGDAPAKIAIRAPEAVGKLGYPKAQHGSDGKASWFIQKSPDGFEYCVCLETRRVASETFMAISITCTHDSDDPLALARKRCADAVAKSYAEMLEPHAEWWAGFWSKSSIRIPEAKLQRLYQFVRYLYGAGSRLGHPPMPLQGVWTADAGGLPPWKGDYHNDLNTQTTYLGYQAVGNFDEGNAWLDYLWRLRPTWQAFARDFYGTEGLATPGTMTVTGQPLGGWGAYSLSPTMTAWNGHLFYLHWLYTNDDKFLRERAYPWCRDAALCMKGLLKPNKDGILVLPRTSSPEIRNNFYGLHPNSNYDIACLKMLFVSLAEMGTVLGKTDEVKMWRDLDKGLGDHHVGPDGELWIDAKRPLRGSHRHQSNIIAFHPFNLITIDGTETERKRIAASMPWWSQPGKVGGKLGTRAWVGFSFPWVASACARTGDAEGALQHLQAFDKSYTTRNGFNENYPGKHIFTLEANFLAMQAVNEMLLQTWSPTPGTPDTGVIRIFPAMPWAWHDASFIDLRAEGGHRVSAKRENNATTWFGVTAGKNGILRIRDNFNARQPTWSLSGVRKNGNNFEIELKKGQSIEATFVKPVAVPAAPEYHTPMTVDYRNELILPALSDNCTVTASSNFSSDFDAHKAFDGNTDTRWAAKEKDKGWIAVDLGSAQKVGRVVLMELAYVSCQEFTIECQIDGKWKEIARGSTINGVKKIDLPPVITRHVRVTILKTKGDRPTLGEVRVFPPS